MTILETIERKHYVVTDHDVELLAAAHMDADKLTKRTDGHYLRILCAGAKAQFGDGKSRRKLTAADSTAIGEFVASLHDRLYPFILKGITTPEVVDDDTLSVDTRRARAAVRNARAGFARSSASTLQAFIRTGGDVRALDVATVTKGELRRAARARTAPGESPQLHAVEASLKRLTRDALRLAAESPEEARHAIEHAMRELGDVLEGLGPNDEEEMRLPAARAAATESGVFQRERGARFRPRTAAA